MYIKNQLNNIKKIFNENRIDEKIKKRNQLFLIFKTNAVIGILLKDILVFNNWLSYAKMIVDLSYKILNKDFYQSIYIQNELSK